jgi:UDP-glucose 4-epimerase
VDLAAKIDRDPRRLEILGDGTQRKSYVDVEDASAAMLLVARGLADAPPKTVETCNVGTADTADVREIARTLCEELHVDPEFVFKAEDGGRGWRGDVKSMQLDCARLLRLGWNPRRGSAAAVRRAARWIASLRERPRIRIH